MHVYIYVYMFMWTCICVCVCVCVYIYIYIYGYCVYACVSLYVCWYVYIYVYIYIYMCVCVCMCVSMYMYIYTLTIQWAIAIKREYVFRDSLALRKALTICFLTNFYLFSNCITTTQYLKPLKITSLGKAKNNTLNNTLHSKHKKPEYLKTFLLFSL